MNATKLWPGVRGVSLAVSRAWGRDFSVRMFAALVWALVGTAMGPFTVFGARPNVLLILADDMGYSGLGCYGSEIETPHIDSLAAHGIRYSQFYNTARCWPTRAALLTGYYAQQVGRDSFPTADRRKRRRTRPIWAQLLPKLLQPYGYDSYHSGKWHLDGQPLENGFVRSYRLADHDRYFSPSKHTLDDQDLPSPAPDGTYYATQAIADHAIHFLTEHKAKNSGRPFFEYVAFTSPHFPLQAPQQDVARYAKRYQIGWDQIRAARWQKIQQLQRLPGELSKLEPHIGPPYHFAEALEQLGSGEVNRELAWDSLTADQQTFQATKMAIHAAMIDRMDHHIGRIVDHLRQTGELDNTVIFVLSDNGASAEIMIRGDGHDVTAVPGSAASYLCLGPGWSRAANTPFRRHKTWVHEGGISTPLVVHWPAGIKSQGEWRKAVGHVIDIAPTIVELAGGEWPQMVDTTPVPPAAGLSLAATFDEDKPLEREALWWCHEGNRAIRAGDWKLVAAQGEPWQLYDLGQDRAETHDLAEELGGKVHELTTKWNDYTTDMQQLLESE